MVYMSGSKKSRYIGSIINQPQGGGPKKAGLVPTATGPYGMFINYKVRHLPQSRATMAITMFPNVRQSRPISGRPENYIGSGGNY